jgi:predicted negative regulator of RcsB-dependent stress response
MTRHQLKEQDEITSHIQKYTEFVVARRNEFTIGATALAVVLIVIFGWRYYSATRTASAETQLSQAIDIFNDTANIKSDKERYEKTIVEAQKTYDQYGSLQAGIIALYYTALSEE